MKNEKKIKKKEISKKNKKIKDSILQFFCRNQLIYEQVL